ncbi:MAG: copper-transporting ATPase [Blastocatellia bacterium]
MDNIEIAVLIGGVAAIAFVLWYFFGERQVVSATATSKGTQEIVVSVKGGFVPDRIEVKNGLPVRLHFYRDETDSCSEQVVIPDFRIFANLPAFKTTTIEFTPDKKGEFEFTCGMNMLRGKIIVR